MNWTQPKITYIVISYELTLMMSSRRKLRQIASPLMTSSRRKMTRMTSSLMMHWWRHNVLKWREFKTVPPPTIPIPTPTTSMLFLRPRPTSCSWSKNVLYMKGTDKLFMEPWPQNRFETFSMHQSTCLLSSFESNGAKSTKGPHYATIQMHLLEF